MARHVVVLALFKDVETYLRGTLLPALDAIASKDPSELTFSFYFLENDSKDGTRRALEEFFTTHDGRLFTLDGVASTGTFPPDGIQYARISHFIKLRNHLLDAVRPQLKAADFVCILDADIYIDASVVSDLVSVLDSHDDIVMVAPYQLEFTNKAKLSGIMDRKMLEHIPDNEVFSLGHNYDTFALQYASDETITWPWCRFQRCQLCKNTAQYKVESTNELVDVLSCFNGLAILKGEAFAWPLRYSTTHFRDRHMALCEHVMFCHDVRMWTGKRIVIAQNIIVRLLAVA